MWGLEGGDARRVAGTAGYGEEVALGIVHDVVRAEKLAGHSCFLLAETVTFQSAAGGPGLLQLVSLAGPWPSAIPVDRPQTWRQVL